MKLNRNSLKYVIRFLWLILFSVVLIALEVCLKFWLCDWKSFIYATELSSNMSIVLLFDREVEWSTIVTRDILMETLLNLLGNLNHIIQSTLDVYIQHYLTCFVNSVQYPASVHTSVNFIGHNILEWWKAFEAIIYSHIMRKILFRAHMWGLYVPLSVCPSVTLDNWLKYWRVLSSIFYYGGQWEITFS